MDSSIVGKCPFCGGNIHNFGQAVAIFAVLVRSSIRKQVVEKVTENRKQYCCDSCEREFDTIPS